MHERRMTERVWRHLAHTYTALSMLDFLLKFALLVLLFAVRTALHYLLWPLGSLVRQL